MFVLCTHNPGLQWIATCYISCYEISESLGCSEADTERAHNTDDYHICVHVYVFVSLDENCDQSKTSSSQLLLNLFPIP